MQHCMRERWDEKENRAWHCLRRHSAQEASTAHQRQAERAERRVGRKTSHTKTPLPTSWQGVSSEQSRASGARQLECKNTGKTLLNPSPVPPLPLFCATSVPPLSFLSVVALSLLCLSSPLSLPCPSSVPPLSLVCLSSVSPMCLLCLCSVPPLSVFCTV